MVGEDKTTFFETRLVINATIRDECESVYFAIWGYNKTAYGRVHKVKAIKSSKCR